MRVAKARSRLKRAAAPFQDFWVSLAVKRTGPRTESTESWPPETVGYYRNVGIRARPSRLKAVIESYVKEGAIDWADTEFERVNPEDLNSTIQQRIRPIESEGVWYESGRAFYPEDTA